MKIVFMGSAEFGIPSLKRIIDSGFDVRGIVTTPAREKGRGLKTFESPVAQFALQNSIKPLIKPESLNDSNLIKTLETLEPDLFIVIAYRILPYQVFSIPSMGTINVHASLLPAYRGPAPIQRAIEAGEMETGITVFKIDHGIDTGNIILQRKISIGTEDTTPEVYERLSNLSADAMEEVCNNFESGNIHYKEQNNLCATLAPKLNKHEAAVNWNLTVFEIFNKIRAFKPFPGTYSMLDSSRLGIEWALPGEKTITAIPGTITKVNTDSFEVQCADGCLKIVEVKPEGKKKMTTSAFLNGNRIQEGTLLR